MARAIFRVLVGSYRYNEPNKRIIKRSCNENDTIDETSRFDYTVRRQSLEEGVEENGLSQTARFRVMPTVGMFGQRGTWTS